MSFKAETSATRDNITNKKPGNLKANILRMLKLQPAGGSAFDRAKSLFALDTKRVLQETDHDWEKYIENRFTAEKNFHGYQEEFKEQANMQMNLEGEDGDDNAELYDDEMLVLDLIRQSMAGVEEDMCLDGGILQRSFRLLACEPVFGDDGLCSVTVLTRIYSPTRPTYIDTHFQYHWKPVDDAVEWHYSLGFKIYKRPGTNDYRPPEVKQFERGRFDRGHTTNGWRPIAYGFYDNIDNRGRNWRKIEKARFLLEEEDAKDICEAFWGFLGEDDYDYYDDDDAESERRKKTVDSIRILLAAVGIHYDIAVDEDDMDSPGGTFVLEGLSDRWFARGVRKACGFQLTDDPENERKGKKEQEIEARGVIDDDEFDSEDDDSDNYT